jgi:hypothetical protein
MKIDQRLNIVIPLDIPGGGVMHVHSTPISRDVFERYFMTIARTFSAIYNQGLGVIGGPRVAALLLRKVAEDAGEWDGPAGVEYGLMAEVRRLTNVVALDPTIGWTTLPYQDALDGGIVDPEDAAEVENAIVFFTVASAMHRRSEMGSIFDGLSSLWGAQTSSLNCMAFAASLPTSTETANTGARETPSSIPS